MVVTEVLPSIISSIYTEFEYLLFNGSEGQLSRLISEVAQGGLYSKESDCASYHWARSEKLHTSVAVD